MTSRGDRPKLEHSDIQREQDSPVPPFSKCTAFRNFKGREAHDLPFHRGEELTIIEPCNVVFWYLAENAHGRRGVIPINFVKLHSSKGQPRSMPTPPTRKRVPSRKAPPPPTSPSSSPHPSLPPKPLPSPKTPTTPPPKHTPPLPPPKPTRGQLSKTLPRSHPEHRPVMRSASSDVVRGDRGRGEEGDIDIDSRPPAPLPPEAFPRKPEPVIFRRPGKYRTFADFREKSGWFTPTVDNCLCRMVGMQKLAAFMELKEGLYLFMHKEDPKLKFICRSYHLHQDLITLFHRLFERPEQRLSPIEVQLKYHHSDASSWYVRVRIVRNPHNLDLEEAKWIVHHRTLQPEGLNEELQFFSREQFLEFAEWYATFRRSSQASIT